MPIGTVMARLSRARSALREKVRGTAAAAAILGNRPAAIGHAVLPAFAAAVAVAVP